MRYNFAFYILSFIAISSFSQGADLGKVTGSFQTDAQLYQDDEKIGAIAPDEKLGLNSYLNLNYQYKSFSAGTRAELYAPALQGYDPRFEGFGFPYRFIRYADKRIDITVGNSYEQFGNGLLLRTYEDRGLGFDNSIDGINLKYKGDYGLTLKAIVGNQRYYFDKGPGLVRGLDLDWNISEILDSVSSTIKIGVSGVSKFQDDNDPVYNLPENVAALSGRIQIQTNTFQLNTEYGFKFNDPSFSNRNSYRTGEVFLLNASYIKSGFTSSITLKRIDNFDFRSDRSATGNDLLTNYLPSLTINYTNRLFSLYPYVTQNQGEFGGQFELSYKFKKGSSLGGKYGTYISLNYTRIHDIKRDSIDSPLEYESGFFDVDEQIFYQALSLEFSKKWSKKLKQRFIYQYLESDNSVLLVADFKGTIAGHIVVLENQIRLSRKSSLKAEIQGLFTNQDQGSWATLLLEYYPVRKIFINFLDDYNYGNPEEKVHYASVGAGYRKDGFRLGMSYGRQRAGVLCVGGICRIVPSTTGLSINLSQTF